MAVIRYKNSGVPFRALEQITGPAPCINLYRGNTCVVQELFADRLLIKDRAYCIEGSQMIVSGERECCIHPPFVRLRDYNGYEIIEFVKEPHLRPALHPH